MDNFSRKMNMIIPKWLLKQNEELGFERAKLSHFATDEQIKEIERVAYEYAITTTASNHEIVIHLMSQAYNVFASGGDFEKALTQVKEFRISYLD